MTRPRAVKSRIAMRRSGAGHQSTGGYTLVEVMVVMGLLTLLMIAAAGSVSAGKTISTRSAEYTAALAIVHAQLETVRSSTYNVPSQYFNSTPTIVRQYPPISLNQAGTTFVVPGTVVTTTTILPSGTAHLVQVVGTFGGPTNQCRGTPITVNLQTVVNQFAPGQP